MNALCLLVALAAVPVSHRKVVTEDGAALALYRFEAEYTRAPPVLLLADVGFGRLLLEPLAQYLAERGRTVYVAELRGQGRSSGGASLRAHVHLDFPAIARVIGEPVDLVAHGYVGALALAAAGRELPVRRVVALNVPMTPEPPTELQRRFLQSGARFSTLAASPEGRVVFEQLFAMESPLTGKLLREGTRDLSPSIAMELLTWLELGDLPLDDGTSVLERLRAYDRPTLMFLALADAWAPPEACVTLRQHGRAEVKQVLFSRFTHGDDFAHATLLRGDNAARHVFAPLEAFLR